MAHMTCCVCRDCLADKAHRAKRTVDLLRLAQTALALGEDDLPFVLALPAHVRAALKGFTEGSVADREVLLSRLSEEVER